uniref:Uncharacterized protein n=1 Tax=Magallana gigas TaxID=29159 RepID=K1PK10_MAGGI
MNTLQGRAKIVGDGNCFYRLHNNSGEWADEPIIQAAADLYGFNIYVSSYGNSGVTQRVRATSEQLRHDSGRLLHLRLQNSHYTCIEHDCQTDSVPSGDFVEMPVVIDFGKQYGAEPYEASLDVLDYSKTVGLPKTVGDDESSNAGIDPFNMEDLKSKLPVTYPRKNERQIDYLAKKKTINTVTEVQERELENQKDINDVLCEDVRNITIAEEKTVTPKQKFTRCRDIEHLKEWCKTGQVNRGTECKVRRTKFGHEYHHYFMIWEVLVEGLDIVHLTLTWPLRICCEILRVGFANRNNSLLDFQQAGAFN